MDSPAIIAIVIAIIVVTGMFLFTGPSTINVVTGDPAQLQNTLSVSGTVEKMVTPDQVEIYLSVRTLNKSASVSQSENATIAEAVRTALKNAGVEDKKIQTISYTVQEEYEWNSSMEKSVPVGYRTVNSVKVTLTDTKKAGTIIDAAVGAGANSVDSINFTLSKVLQEQVKKEALKDAALEAKVKAEAMAGSLGVTLDSIKNVSESYNYPYYNYRSYDLVAMPETKGSATPISPTDVSISATVNVVYEIK